jgi:DNA-binding transcriptional MocR family regulator
MDNIKIEPIQFDNDSLQPRYIQLFQYIKDLIIEGRISTGEKLPAIRNLSNELKVNNVTVVNAYKQLENTGYITAKKGSGFYVSKRPAKDEKNNYFRTEDGKNIINFASASPHPSIFPTESFKECINEVIERDKGYAFSYQESNGFEPLKECISDFLNMEHDIDIKPHNLQIVSGAQQGLDIIGKVLLNSGDYVITETPTYDGALEVFKTRGARCVGVNIKDDGIDLIELEKKIRICKPKILYVMTKFQNPTTVCYSKEKISRLLQLASKYDVFIVEDDSTSEISFKASDRYSLKAMDKDDKVIYIKSFSKILMPGLRVGTLVIPKSLISEFTQSKYTSDISSSSLIQRSVDLFYRKGKWNEHTKYMKEIYKGKYEFMLSKLENLRKYNVDFKEPNGGLYFWVKLPQYINSKTLHEKCLERELLVLPSHVFYPNAHKLKNSFIRLSFAFCSIEEIKTGMEILEDIIKNSRADI